MDFLRRIDGKEMGRKQKGKNDNEGDERGERAQNENVPLPAQ